MTTTNTLRNALRLAACATSIVFSVVARKRPLLIVLALIALGMAMTGCQDNSPVSPSPEAGIRPGIGSTYIYKVTPLDSQRNEPASYDTLTVSRVGLQIGGKRDVVEISSRRSNYDYTTYSYYVFESNGDISKSLHESRLDNGDTTYWLVLPVGSRTPKNTEFTDNGRYADIARYVFTNRHAGSESIKVGAASIESQKIVQKVSLFSTQGNSMEYETPIWWGRSIGCFTKLESTDNKGELLQLISYRLK